jgi:hypothetical protein
MQFYPEIQSAGSLRLALSQALGRTGCSFVADDSPDLLHQGSTGFKVGHRFAFVAVAARERLFLLEFWSHGVVLASGKCPDLYETASAIHRWVSDPQLRVAYLSSAFDWVKAKDGANAFEEGREVEWKWGRLLQEEDRLPEIRTLAARAATEPRLRILFPHTSMHTLCFSRCTGYPFTRDTPCITPLWDGRYGVCTGNEHEIGRGDLDFAVRLAVENLPSHSGPARAGTANDDESNCPKSL